MKLAEWQFNRIVFFVVALTQGIGTGFETHSLMLGSFAFISIFVLLIVANFVSDIDEKIDALTKKGN
jgi:hypothetical protein